MRTISFRFWSEGLTFARLDSSNQHQRDDTGQVTPASQANFPGKGEKIVPSHLIPSPTPEMAAPLSLTESQGEDARVNSMKRLLKRTDWTHEIQVAFLNYTTNAIILPSIQGAESVKVLSKMRESLETPRWFITAENERRAVLHLQNTIDALEASVQVELQQTSTNEPDRSESLNRAQQDLDQALNASAGVKKEPKREVLALLCSLLGDSISHVEATTEQQGSDDDSRTD